MPEISEAWLALIGVLLGGTGLKVTEYLLLRGSVKVDDAAVIRKELREDVSGLRQQIRTEKEFGDKWRSDYYKEIEKLYATKREILVLENRVSVLEDELRDYREKYRQLWQDMFIERDAPNADVNVEAILRLDEV